MNQTHLLTSVTCLPLLRRVGPPISVLGRICLLAFKIPLICKTCSSSNLHLDVPWFTLISSGWFTLNCCVMAGPCLYQVAIRIRALSSNPRSAHVCRNCSHGQIQCMLYVPSLLISLCPEFLQEHSFLGVRLHYRMGRTQEWKSCKRPSCHK